MMAKTESIPRTAELSEAKRLLLEKLRRGEITKPTAGPSVIGRRPLDKPAPLSPAQEQLWLFERATPGGPPLYNESFTLYRTGPLDADVLQRCLTEIVRRHEIWRTHYDGQNGQPVQIIHEPPPIFPLIIVDLRQVPEVERPAEALRLATEQARRPFDFQRGPLLRATLVRMGAAGSQLMMTGHQSIIDGVSVYQLFPKELTQLYDAFAAGKPSPLPELPIQFADFAYWQRQSPRGEVLLKQVAYWRNRLGGELPALTWPTDRPRPAQQTLRGTVQLFAWSRELSQSLEALRRRQEFTLFTILTAGYVALLHRYTRQNDIIVGTLAPAGRERSEAQELLGCFLNPVALRFDLSPGMTFRDLLRQTQEVVVEAISHGDVPLEQVAEALNLRPDPSRNPFFTVGVSLQPPPMINSGWTVTSMDADNGGSRWDLYVAFIERPEGLIGRAQYNPDLFEPSTIEQMLDDWQKLLARAAAHPHQLLSSLPIRSAAVGQRPDQLQPQSEDRISPSLARPDFPQRPAVAGPAEMPERDSHQPDDSLSSVGDTLVMPQWFFSQNSWVRDPVKSNNSAYNYPILLRLKGALDSGALERSLREIVSRHEMLRAAFQLVNEELIAHPQPAALPPLSVTHLAELGNAEAESRARSLAIEEATQPFDLRCGLLLRAKLLRLGGEDHMLLLNTHHIVCDDWSTGILLRELSILYGAFVAGKPSPLPALSYRYGDFARWLASRLKGDGVAATLSFWKQNLAGNGGFHHLPCDFPRPAQQTIHGAHESAFFSEDVVSSLKLLSRQEHVSLFMTLLAAFKFLLHRYSGEEDIGVGSCVANRPLTQVEGLVGPFGNVVVIRTDLSENPTFRELLKRVRESSLTGLSRQDLPFGELVRALEPSPTVDRNPLFQVLFVLENAPKEQCHFPGLTVSRLPLDAGTTRFELNLWLRIRNGLDVELQYNTDLFRAATIRQILDDYQAVLRTVAKEPGTRIHNLPVSRKAEPARVQLASTLAQATLEQINGAAPKDDVQLRLVELWEAAFGIRPIGVDQDFFELGGDSLLAARLFTQIEKTFKKDLPLAALLEAPTIKQLAGAINGRRICASSSSLVAIQPLGSKPPLFCVHGHMGQVFYCRNLSRSLGTDQPLFGLRSQGLAGEPPNYTVEDMALCYLKVIRAVQPRGPYFVSGLCFGGMVAYEMARLLKTQGEDVALLAIFNTPAPGSLSGWPLRRTYLTKRIGHELRKLHGLAIREKIRIIHTKTVGLSRLLSGNLKAAVCRALAKSSIRGAEQGARRLLSVADINVSAAKAYGPGAYPGRVTLFLTEEAPSLYAIDPRDGWKTLAGDGIEIHSVAGDNNSMFDEGFADKLAERLSSCLERVHPHRPASA